MYENKKRDWARTRDLVFPEIRDDPQEYERRVKHGLRDAEAYLETRAQHELFTLETIQRTHELIFARVYEFAGEFRQPGQEPAVGQENWDAAFHSRVKPELERLRAFVDKALERVKGQEQKAQLVSLCHAQFERIHPFHDGNGRTGRALLEAQVRTILEQEPSPTVDRAGYIEALARAQNESDLGSLSKAVTGIALPEQLKKAEYSMDLWPVAIEKETPQGTTFRVHCDGIDTAEDVRDAVVSERLAQLVDKNPRADLPLSLDTSSRTLKLDIDERAYQQEQLKREAALQREREMER